MATNLQTCLTTDTMWQTAIENNVIEIDHIDAYWNGSSWVSNNNFKLSFRLGPITWTGTPSTTSTMNGKSLILVLLYNPTNSSLTTQLVGSQGSDTGTYINTLLSTYYNSSTQRRFLVATAQGAPSRTNTTKETIEVSSISSISNGIISGFKFKWRGKSYFFSQLNYTSTDNLVYMKFDDKSQTLIVNSKNMPVTSDVGISDYFTECSRLFDDGWYILNSHSGNYNLPLSKTKTVYFQNYGGRGKLNIETETITTGSTNTIDNRLQSTCLNQDNTVVTQRQFGHITTINSSGQLVWYNNVSNTTMTVPSILFSDGKQTRGTYDCIFTNNAMYATLYFVHPETSGSIYTVDLKTKTITNCNRFSIQAASLADFALYIEQKSDFPIFKLTI